MAAPPATTLEDRCPKCRCVDYLPLPDLQAHCYKCKTTYQRGVGKAVVVKPAPSRGGRR